MTAVARTAMTSGGGSVVTNTARNQSPTTTIERASGVDVIRKMTKARRMIAEKAI